MAPTEERRRTFKIPASMPDGVHRRKLEKIKKTLSHNASVKRSYRKTLKEMRLELPQSPSQSGVKQDDSVDPESLNEHNDPNEQEATATARQKATLRDGKKSKVSRFKREEAAAAELRAAKMEAQRERESREAERRLKVEQRQKNKRKMMQYTKTGQPKLGARVDVLLGKIREGTSS
ncbi:hypothetical protein V1525DRAFT_398467 [Lipomyces kononenkoae]|uniref:Uncharacterized protein n=1 Tax=Lipomyces kononenkoae TaxID=34357 RepID=A0ACC3T5U9_LIPKO